VSVVKINFVELFILLRQIRSKTFSWFIVVQSQHMT